MVRFIFPVTLALGAILVAGNAATAGDNGLSKVGATAGRTETATMTLGGKGTAASAASSADTELAWYHGYYRGYRRGFYNGYYGGLGGYYAGYYPYAYPYANPYYYGAAYYPPLLGVGVRVGRVAVGVGINGNSSDVSAPAVALNLGGSAPQQQTPPANEQPGAYRYDGGPANPVPLPKQDSGTPNGQATPTLPANTGLPVSLPKTVTTAKPTKPYTYKGFGEK
ncbi:MAG TPA: hypothetical protein VG097_10900 [Gemmata sp.]|jgi:hypothetical protein|nr:hypothetical protein [Gemmata sp.]